MNFVSKIKNIVYETGKALVNTFREKVHISGLKKVVPSPTPEYDHYLTGQLKRTIVKNSNSLLPRTEILVNLLMDKGKPPLSSRTLCIGCRNTAELDYFQSKGLKYVIGIDLLSESPRIQIMDMHNLTFADNSFDIVYSAHSLEHSYDIEKVVREIIRVVRSRVIIAIEVPVRYAITESDRYDLKNVDGLMALFPSCQTEILWSDDLEARMPGNNEGTPIVRVIFRIVK